MYPAAQTYWLEPTKTVAVGLRRYTSPPWATGEPRDCEHGWHDVLVYIGRDEAQFNEHGYRDSWSEAPQHDDPRWPTRCERCDYVFTAEDTWQPWSELIYQQPGTGKEYVIHSNPACSAQAVGAPQAAPGACYDAWWYHRKGPDGISLAVVLPNQNVWLVDSEANNCTRKGESHYCWIRKGDPKAGTVTVGKDGNTCAAGAGSIQSGEYHGFLQNGVLTAG
jgi:hypothetical protein